jgi:hypothetical protein
VFPIADYAAALGALFHEVPAANGDEIDTVIYSGYRSFESMLFSLGRSRCLIA